MKPYNRTAKRLLAPAGNGRAMLLTILLVCASPAMSQTAERTSNGHKPRLGVACVVGPNAGASALHLAEAGWLTLALDSTPERVDGFTRSAAQSGLLGRGLYVELGSLDKIPFADNYVDLLALDDTVGSELSNARKTEILRVLTPIHGRAVLKDQTIRKPELPGSGWWTHRAGGPDNNPVATDTAFTLPAMIQFAATPFYSSYQGSLLVAGGYRIELYDWMLRYAGTGGIAPIAGKILARNFYNGQVLWMADLPKQIKPDSQICATDGKRIFIADDPAGQVRVINLADGAELPPIRCAQHRERSVTWLALEDGRLHVLLGDRDWPQIGTGSPHASVAKNQSGDRNNYRELGEYPRGGQREQTPPGKDIACAIVAWDIAAGRELWRHDEPAVIDFRVIAQRGRQVFFYADNAHLACLGPDGRIAWENKDRSWMDKLDHQRVTFNHNVRNSSSLVVGPSGQLIMNLTQADKKLNGLVFAAKDGRLLWEIPNVPLLKSAFVKDKLHISNRVFDATTGAALDAGKSIGGGCGFGAWIPGAQAIVGHDSFGFKSPCAVPVLAAGGALHYMASVCNCVGFDRGTAAYMPAAASLEAVRSETEPPIEKGKPVAPALAVATGDWPAYRADARHLGASVLPAPKTPQTLWRSSPSYRLPVPPGHFEYRWDWLERPTPSITAGGSAFVADSTGLLRAVRIADGQEMWTYRANGAIMTPPVIAGGRLYVGSGDGWLTCLDAATGTMAWRRRATGEDRRILVFGKLVSSWPVTSVVVFGETVVGLAGTFEAHGSLLIGMDAKTGRLLWRQWLKKADGEKQLFGGYAAVGHLAALDGTLPSERYAHFPLVFDIHSGQPPNGTEPAKLVAIPLESEQDCIVVDEQLILRGGAPLNENPDVRQLKYTGNYSSFRLGDFARPMKLFTDRIPFKGLMSIARSTVSPSINGNQIVLVGGVGYPKGRHTAGVSFWALDTWKAQRPGSHGQPLDFSKAAWNLPDLEVSAVVLCKDAVLALVGERIPKGRTPYGQLPKIESWALMALSRVDGRELWRRNLPMEPIFNGLTPSADGTWIVTLRDGSLLGVGERFLQTMPDLRQGRKPAT